MRIWLLTVVAAGVHASTGNATPLVYTGYSVAFAKAAFADGTLPENQDRIVYDVAITRGSSRGIFNVAQEQSYQDSLSPQGTAWAFPYNNPGATLSAATWSQLVFQPWQTAHGGAGSGPPATVGQNAVLHLVDQDIYLDIRFTAWGMSASSGGSFSYDRARVTPSADFDRNGDVDGRDFLTWQQNFLSSDALQSEGDADFNGLVSAEDLSVWRADYGGMALAIVPEPGWLCLSAGISAGLLLRRLSAAGMTTTCA
jgi:hypothetical protein